MQAGARIPLRVHPLISVTVIAICTVTLLWLLWPIHQLVGQIYGLIILGLGLRYAPGFQPWFTSIPALHRILFLGLIGAMIIGHLKLDGRTYFPFVTWRIFQVVREEDPVTCREFIAKTKGGKSVRLLVEQLFPSIVQFNPPDSDSPEMSQLVVALGKVYNEHHVADPVRQIDLVRIAVKLHPTSQQSQMPPTCELLKRYDLSSAR